MDSVYESCRPFNKRRVTLQEGDLNTPASCAVTPGPPPPCPSKGSQASAGSRLPRCPASPTSTGRHGHIPALTHACRNCSRNTTGGRPEERAATALPWPSRLCLANRCRPTSINGSSTFFTRAGQAQHERVPSHQAAFGEATQLVTDGPQCSSALSGRKDLSMADDIGFESCRE